MLMWLFIIHFALVPAMQRNYERQLEKQQTKFDDFASKTGDYIVRLEQQQIELKKTYDELVKVREVGEKNHKLLQQALDAQHKSTPRPESR